jgi:hypothetical protein
MEISSKFANEILEEAASLKQRYGEDGMLDLLKGEQRRLANEQTLTLGSSHELLDGAVKSVTELVIRNYALTKAIFATYVVEQIINYLAVQNVIDPANFSRDKFVIMLVVGLALDKIKEAWEKHKEAEKHQQRISK